MLSNFFCIDRCFIFIMKFAVCFWQMQVRKSISGFPAIWCLLWVCTWRCCHPSASQNPLSSEQYRLHCEDHLRLAFISWEVSRRFSWVRSPTTAVWGFLIRLDFWQLDRQTTVCKIEGLSLSEGGLQPTRTVKNSQGFSLQTPQISHST